MTRCDPTDAWKIKLGRKQLLTIKLCRFLETIFYINFVLSKFTQQLTFGRSFQVAQCRVLPGGSKSLLLIVMIMFLIVMNTTKKVIVMNMTDAGQ